MRRTTLPALIGAFSAIQKIGGVSNAIVKKRTPHRARRLASDTFRCSSSKMRYCCHASSAAKGIQNAMERPYPRSPRCHAVVEAFTISIVFWHRHRLAFRDLPAVTSRIYDVSSPRRVFLRFAITISTHAERPFGMVLGDANCVNLLREKFRRLGRKARRI